MTLNKFLMVGFVAASLTACGDNGSNPVNDSDVDSSSSVSENRNDISSSSGKVDSSSDKSSSSETSVSSSSLSSSSSAARSSSSVSLKVPACRSSDDDDNCEYGSLTDERDGKAYKTVKIGEQEWMAENLNYEAENSYCYKDEADKCKSIGRLYTWESALTACPDGWHLPTMAEFETLIISVDGGSRVYNHNASLSLLNRQFNDYGFSAYEGGFRRVDGTYDRIGSDADFWSSTENDGSAAFNLYLNWVNKDASLYDADKGMGFSVRCLKGISTKLEAATETAYSGVYGTLTDERDGKTYKTVKIGNQTWMAENLNLETEESICYEDSPENCEKYGRLYDWNEATHREGVCPEGWHLPSYAEFEALIETTGSKATAGRKLKSTTGWYSDGNGTDAYGFAALPAGFDGFSLDSLNNQGFSANFWTSSMDDSGYAYHLYITFSDDDVGLNATDVDDKYSVRCVLD